MEVGAVKQAFNNEVILLKKKLNQARIQIIHKLTRKAKQLTEKKAPEKLQEKLKRKAESAVKEVLVIKKIKARDIAKFIITHKGELKSYLNKPQIDYDKAYARLLLHKSMQEKYNFIKNRFGNVPIKDLFMSRQERLKLKKEEKLKQKNKKKAKNSKTIIEEGNWDVEDIESSNNIVAMAFDKDNDDKVDNDSMDADDDDNKSYNLSGDSDHSIDSDDINDNSMATDDDSDENDNINNKIVEENSENEDNENNELSDGNENNEAVGKFVKLSSASVNNHILENKSSKKFNTVQKNDTSIDTNKLSNNIDVTKNKKLKDRHKNRNLNEKIKQNKFKKTLEANVKADSKVVDPFFITSTGEHYMSLAEPRQPDEVKEIHKQGNRKLRRAVMFGHEIKMKPRSNYENNNFTKNNKLDSGFKNKNDRITVNDNKSGFINRNSISQDKFGQNERFNGRKGEFNSRKFNDKVSVHGNKDNVKDKDEKLHPSWEAKKRQSGILPFQGKKIVFDEN